MSSNLLLPHCCKTIGWFILVPATIAGMYLTITGYESEALQSTVFALFSESLMSDLKLAQFITANVTNTVVGVLFIIGGLMVSFSREKVEDEFIANLRLSSLLWSVWVNYILLLLAFIFVYGVTFFNVMVYNMFTILIIFIIRFNVLLHRSSKAAIA